MKKTLLILMGFCFSILNIQADEQKKVNLDSNHDKETVSLPYCNFFVSLADKDDNEAQVKIELENLDETNVLILFDRAYDEKTIKKMPTSIRFDKTYGGSKNKRVIDPYEGNARQVMLFRPSDKFELPRLTVNNGEPLNCRLPIYIAKSKGKKLLLLEKQVIELSIEVEMKPSAEYLGLKDKTDRLARELSNAVICTNPKHKTSASKQRDAYEKRINSLKGDIDDAIKSHNWQPDSRGYMRYNDLKKQLDDIDLSSKEGDCGKHRARKGGGGSGGGHSCSYCSLSLQQIYHRLDDLYKKIYSSSDRKAAKASVISQVNALYTCASTSSCSKHASEWKTSSYKSKITERYNRISGM